MCSKIFNFEEILSINEEWTQLEEKWGEPIDLDTDDELPSRLNPVFSTLDLRKTTFDSSSLFKSVRRNVTKQLTKDVLDYKEFIQDLQESESKKPFYSRQMSKVSIEDICNEIDEIFKSVEKLCSTTSTVRKKFPEVVSCSISTDGLSFDDTIMEEEKYYSDDIEMYMDEAFERLSLLSYVSDDEISKESVTTLVRKFSSILSSPTINCSPRRRRQCCDKFKELAEFWNNRT